MRYINILDVRGAESDYNRGVSTSLFSELTGRNRTLRIHWADEDENVSKEIKSRRAKGKYKRIYELICVRYDRAHLIPNIFKYLEEKNLNAKVLQYDLRNEDKPAGTLSGAELCDFVAGKYKLDKK